MVRILGPRPFKVRGARLLSELSIPVPVWGSVIFLQGWAGTHARHCNPATSRGKGPSPVETQPETGESGQPGAGILALLLTLPLQGRPLLSVAAVSFTYFYPLSFLLSFFFFLSLTPSFFFLFFFLHLPSFCPNLSLRFHSKSFFRRVKGWLRESFEVSFPPPPRYTVLNVLRCA